MRASPHDWRRPRERCCATTLSINTGLFPGGHPVGQALLEAVLSTSFCWIECLSGVRSPYPHRAFQGTDLTGHKSPTARPACRSASGSSVYSSSSASRSDTRSLGSENPGVAFRDSPCGSVALDRLITRQRPPPCFPADRRPKGIVQMIMIRWPARAQSVRPVVWRRRKQNHASSPV
jgi:hypothetical protein